MAGKSDAPAAAYSVADRLLHRLAFAHPVLQKALGELESDLLARRYAHVEARRPVFVTGLPRAGSTLVLETLFATGEFSSFTYREMPFVLAPLLWSDLTKGARRDGARRGRAHGDGVEISFDSPEAFEEVVWLAYLGEKIVGETSLAPVGAADVTSEFRDAFGKLIRKLIAARSAGGAATRYLSKNNANIGRIDALKALFPDATVVLCLREPAAHATSLMTQHRRFLAMHQEDRFAADYMRWIGHFDFGANFRPIDFCARGISRAAAADADFWLRYWIDAYRFAQARLGDGVAVFDYDFLLREPRRALADLARRAGVADEAAVAAAAATIRAPTTAPGELARAEPSLLAEATDLYRTLAG